MKSLVVLFFGMILWTQQAFASRASVAFASKRGELDLQQKSGQKVKRLKND